jgi:hypothetical protein
MLNRRTFFKSIGAAVLGTAIALRLPDSIVPILDIVKTRITYNALREAYINCMRGSNEPNLIIVSDKTLVDIHDMFAYYYRYPIMTEYGGIKFMGATIIRNKMFNQPDNEIQVLGGYKDGRFYF